MLQRIRQWFNKPRNAIPFLFVLLSLLILLVLPVGARESTLLDTGYDWNDGDPDYCDTTPVIGATYYHEVAVTSIVDGEKDAEGNQLQLGERWCMADNGAFFFSNICKLDAFGRIFERSGEVCMIDLTSPGCSKELPDGQTAIYLWNCEITNRWQKV